MDNHVTRDASAAAPSTKWDMKSTQQQQMDRLIIDFIAGSFQPLSRVEDPNFTAILKTGVPSYNIPSRKHLSYTLLPQRKEAIRNTVTTFLDQQPAKSICLTTDLWTNNNMESFIGTTAHCTDDSFNLQSVMLACQRITGKHTAENIKDSFDDVVNSFNLAGKILSVVTDSAANMIKAFVTIPGYEQEDSSSSDDEDDTEDLDTVLTEGLMDYIPDHIKCFLHAMQNAIKEGLEKTGAAKTVIAKTSKFVGSVRHSTHATELLQDEPKLQQRNTTRWNSSNRMLKSITKADPAKLAQVKSSVTLTKNDLKVIKETTDILTPFEDVTAQCEGQNVVTSSLVIPLIVCLKAELQELSTTYRNQMLTTLIDAVDRRLSHYEENPLFQLASILDPRYKLAWCQEDQLEPMKDLLTTTYHELSPPAAPAAAEAQPPAKKKSKLLRHLPSNRTQPASTPTTPSEIEMYLNAPTLDEDANPLDYWRQHQTQFPTLCQLAKRYLAIPASSAPVERLFSIAGRIFSKERSCLSDVRFEELMFVKCNKHLA